MHTLTIRNVCLVQKSVELLDYGKKIIITIILVDTEFEYLARLLVDFVKPLHSMHLKNVSALKSTELLKSLENKQTFNIIYLIYEGNVRSREMQVRKATIGVKNQKKKLSESSKNLRLANSSMSLKLKYLLFHTYYYNRGSEGSIDV